ncbi:hypothetical protein QA802_07790 [Streptomyces sp. B21-105]|uniref:hypothetical protein n=1 Tax=Streptomyces sp. B21-105 TaxID=3039417 RepID=UPI002FEEE70E
MSSARHFLARGSLSDTELKNDIQADITSTRNAQRDLAQAGQHGVAARMSEAVDEHLDELNDANRGTWKPRHA